MPLTTVFNKAFAKVILQLLGAGSLGYGLWLLNPFNSAAAASIIKLALTAAGIEVIVGAFLVIIAVWFIVAVHKELLNQMRWTSMAMTILWTFFALIYIASNVFVAVLPVTVMFAAIFAYCYVKTPKQVRIKL